MKFSIIIPVYNVEEYIEKCISSVLNQDFDDYEIIVVDDETPDNSMAIVQRFANEFPEKIKIIHQKNKGLGGARNTGAAEASGDYLVFLDSDDYLSENMLKEVNDCLEKEPTDMLIFNFLLVHPSGEEIAKRNICAKARVCKTHKEKVELLLSSPAAWNKVYNRAFYSECGAFFPEKMLYEDVVTRYLIARAKSIQLCPLYLYNYVQRDNSIMHSEVSPRVMEITAVTNLILDLFEKNNIEGYSDVVAAAQTTSIYTVIEGVYDRQSNSPFIQQLLSYLTDKFPDYKNNPFLSKEYKQMIDCLQQGGDKKYKRYKKLLKIKEALYQSSVIQKLNAIRKKIGL